MEQDADGRHDGFENGLAHGARGCNRGAGSMIGFGAVYVLARSAENQASRPIGSSSSQSVVAQATPAVVASESAVNPLSQGEMIKFVFKKEPEPVGEIKFVDGSGAARTLAEFKGRVVLMNIWATWCVPCRKEMPALDKLQESMGSDKFEVVAMSVDRAGVAASAKFLESINVKNLKLYADPTARLNGVLKVFAMPSSILIDAEGREVGRLLGEADWNSEDAKKLIRSVLQ